MSEPSIDIRRIAADELPLIRDFPPQEWSLDLEKMYLLHWAREYFYPVVAAVDGEIAGTGIAIINDGVAWLGTIIVKETFRSKGIGKAITDHLVTHARGEGADSILLTASELGLPIYKKIGFREDIDYVFFKTDTPPALDAESENIRPLTDADMPAILALDHAATGERRGKMLTAFLKDACVYHDGVLRGYYLPGFGKGLIVADSTNAGLELLRRRFSRDTSPVCVPASNIAAIELCTGLGFRQYRKIPRMFLYNNVEWCPEHIFSRGAGYCG
jgi:GNAT superfamily N-acetyltransferase